MKTLKWFSLEWSKNTNLIYLRVNLINSLTKYIEYSFYTEQQAFDWLENNGYIERIKEDVAS